MATLLEGREAVKWSRRCAEDIKLKDRPWFSMCAPTDGESRAMSAGRQGHLGNVLGYEALGTS